MEPSYDRKSIDTKATCKRNNLWLFRQSVLHLDPIAGHDGNSVFQSATLAYPKTLPSLRLSRLMPWRSGDHTRRGCRLLAQHQQPLVPASSPRTWA